MRGVPVAGVKPTGPFVSIVPKSLTSSLSYHQPKPTPTFSVK